MLCVSLVNNFFKKHLVQIPGPHDLQFLYFIHSSIVNSGAYRIINGTCAHEESSTVTLAGQNKCPKLRDLKLPCGFNSAITQSSFSIKLLVFAVSIYLVVY